MKFSKKTKKNLQGLQANVGQGAMSAWKHFITHFWQEIRGLHLVRRQVIVWFFLLALLLGTGGLQLYWSRAAYQQPTYVAGGSYAEATHGEIRTTIPWLATTNSEKALANLLYSKLCYYDAAGQIRGEAAAGWSANAEATIWTVRLRDDIYFHDGVQLTADDVIFTIQMIQDPAVRAINADAWRGIDVAKTDDLTLTFTLRAATASFPERLILEILPRHALENAPKANLLESTFNAQPIGSGPFRFSSVQRSGDQGDSIVKLDGNPNYHAGAPLLGSFLLYAYADKAEIKQAVLSGRATATAELAPTELGELPARLSARGYPLNEGVFAFMNTARAPLDQVELRRALTAMTNKSAVANVTGNHLTLDFPILPSQMDLVFPQSASYDLFAAENYLTEAGYTRQAFWQKDGADLTVKMAALDDGSLGLAARELARQWESFGVAVDLTVYGANDSSAFARDVLATREYDVLLYDIAMGADPDMQPYYHSSQTGNQGLNFSNYINPAVDSLLIAANATLDPTTRADNYNAFLREWANDAPAVGLYRNNLLYLVNNAAQIFPADDTLVTRWNRFDEVIYFATNTETRLRTP